MSNCFPQSLDELLEKLTSDGAISVEFMEKNKRRLKLSFDRVNKLETISRERRGFVRSIKYYSYAAYIGVRDIAFSPKDEGFERALMIYTVAWRYIANYDGMSLPDGKARITFNARA